MKAKREAGVETARRKAGMIAASGVARPRPRAGVEAAPILPGKGRKGLKSIAIYMHPLAKEVLVRISEEHGKTIQDLGLEALNLLFRHYDEKPIA